MTGPEPALPRGHGRPPARATLSADPEDFRVTEIEKFHPSGAGTHAWLRIRKRDVNTEEVAIALARVAGAPRSAVGFAGMKDRLSVAVQWFSVDLAGRAEPRWAALESEAIEVLEVASHQRKLRRGALLGNRFEIVLRDVTTAGALLDERLDAVRIRGAPNYFGPQRFGRDGANLRLARSLLVERRPIRDRHRRSLALSAARAHVFNRVLAARVESGHWAAPVPGDVMMLDGRGSVFALDRVDEETAERAARGEIHPTGPLWGGGRAWWPAPPAISKTGWWRRRPRSAGVSSVNASISIGGRFGSQCANSAGTSSQAAAYRSRSRCRREPTRRRCWRRSSRSIGFGRSRGVSAALQAKYPGSSARPVSPNKARSGAPHQSWRARVRAGLRATAPRDRAPPGGGPGGPRRTRVRRESP